MPSQTAVVHIQGFIDLCTNLLEFSLQDFLLFAILFQILPPELSVHVSAVTIFFHSSTKLWDSRITVFIPGDLCVCVCAVVKSPLMFLLHVPTFSLEFAKVFSSTFFSLRSCHHVTSLGLEAAPWRDRLEREREKLAQSPLGLLSAVCLRSPGGKQANKYLQQPQPQPPSAATSQMLSKSGWAEPSHPLV